MFVSAVDINITTLADSAGAGPAGSLRAALNTINGNNIATSYNLIFDPGLAGGTLTLTDHLPVLNLLTNSSTSLNHAILINVMSPVSGIVIDGDAAFQAFFQNSGTVTLNALTIQNALSQGGNGGGDGGNGGAGGGAMGAGGAIFLNSGDLVLQDMIFLNNSAVGGNGGGNSTFVPASGSGGGGMRGHAGVSGIPGSAQGRGGGGLGGAASGATGGTGGSGGAGASAGAAGSNGGSGGGGGLLVVPGDGGNGGSPGGGGGGGAASFALAGDGADGGYGGGGGGGGSANEIFGAGGSSLFGGGGGGGGLNGGAGGAGGTGGGSGASSNINGSGCGGGGAGFGGALFVRSGANLSISAGLADSSFSGGAVTAGAGGTGTLPGDPGTADGSDLYLDGVTASIEVSMSQTMTFNGTIAGSGGIEQVFSNGDLVLNGINTYTGGTHVESGTLIVNGSLASGVTVDVGATLKGVGIINGSSIISGTLDPGNSIGTITFENLTLNSGSTTEMEISPSDNSQIIVTGTAHLAGTLNVTAQAGDYSSASRYTVLTAENGLFGTFSTENLPGSLDLFIVYARAASPARVLLVSGLFVPTTGLTGNSLTIANYLNSNPPFHLTGPGVELGDLTGDELNHALETISPSRNSFATFTTQNGLLSFSDLISSRLANHRLLRPFVQTGQAPIASLANAAVDERELLAQLDSEEVAVTARSPISPLQRPRLQARTQPHNIWMSGFGTFAEQDAEKQNPSFYAASGGLLLAYDYGNLERGVVGGAAGYFHSHISEGEGFGDSYLNSGFATLYGTVYASDFYTEASAWGGWTHINREREIFYPDFSATAKSSTDAFQFDPHLGFGYDFDIGAGTLEPFAACDWVMNFEDGYHEYGADPYNGHVSDHYSSLVRTEVGLNGYYSYEMPRFYFILRGKASYINKQVIHTGSTRASFVGFPSSFVVESLQGSQNLFSSAAELFFKSKGGLYVSLFYDGEFGDGYQMDEIMFKLGYNF